MSKTLSYIRTSFQRIQQPSGLLTVMINSLNAISRRGVVLTLLLGKSVLAFPALAKQLTSKEKLKGQKEKEQSFGDNNNGSKVLVVTSKLEADKAQVDEAVDIIITKGYISAGRGAGIYRRINLDAFDKRLPAESVISTASGITFLLDGASVDPLQFGALGDAVSDDTRAIQKSIDFIALRGGGNLCVRNGVYLISKTISLLPNVNVIGENSALTVFKLAQDEISLFGPHALQQEGTCKIADICLWGYADRNTVQAKSGSLSNPGPFDEIIYQNVIAKHSRFFCLTGQARKATAKGCIITQNLRDGINFSGASIAEFIDNAVSYCADDGIACHTNVHTGSLETQRILVTGNQLSHCTGIKLLGARNATVSNNTTHFCYGYGLYIGVDGSEGQNQKSSIKVVYNVFSNTLNLEAAAGRDRVLGEVIRIDNRKPLSSDGQPNHFNERNLLDASATYGLVIRDNTIVQEKPYRFGAVAVPPLHTWWTHGPALGANSKQALQVTGIAFHYGAYANIEVANNTIIGVDCAIILDGIIWSERFRVTDNRIYGNAINDVVFQNSTDLKGITVKGARSRHLSENLQNLLIRKA